MLNIEKIKKLLSNASILLNSAEFDFSKKDYSAYKDYLSECNSIINDLHSEDIGSDIDILQEVPLQHRAMSGAGAIDEIHKHKEIINVLKKILRLNADLITPEKVLATDTCTILETIFKNFHSAARQLRNRYNKRTTIEIDDEYDVQDLLHGFLKLHFDDIRPEEHTPSYAGGSKRVDFLLKDEKILIEIKKTRKNLTDKEIGEQLIIDIACYSTHPDCKKLYCFVYDPEGKIGNPIGLENDLNALSTDKLKVKVLIFPK